MNVETTGSGPDVVLLHGVPGSPASWNAVRDLLSADHRVHVADLLDHDDLSMPALAEAVAAAVDAPSFVLAGHDFGAPVGLTLAAVHPERVEGVVLAATNAFGDTPVPFLLSTLFLPLAGGLAERLLFSRASLRMMIRQGTGKGGGRPDAGAALARHAAVRTVFADALRNLERNYAPVEHALRGLEVPVEVVWGDRDPFFSVEQARRTAAAAPGSPEPHILEGAGHFLPEERPAELAAAVRRLTRAGARTRPSRSRTPARAATR